MQSISDNRSGPADNAKVARFARTIRMASLQMVHAARLGHPGGDLSAADILAALYTNVLNIDPQNPSWPDRDRFIDDVKVWLTDR